MPHAGTLHQASGCVRVPPPQVVSRSSNQKSSDRFGGKDRMQRRQLLKAVAGAGLGAFCAPMVNRGRYRLFAGSNIEYSARAIELVGRSTVIDMLSPFKLGSTTWFTNPDSFKQSDFQRFKDSGINAFHIAVGVGGADAYLYTLRFIASWDSFLANHDLWLMRVDSASDLERLKTS